MVFVIEGVGLENLQKLIIECSDFIEHPTAVPIIKYFDNDERFKKFKLRHRNKSGDFYRYFNEALSFSKLFQKCLVINHNQENENSYIIIPPNGYQSIHSTLFTNSSEIEQQLFIPLQDLLQPDSLSTIFNDVITNHYKSGDMSEAILEGKELFIYDVPYVYAIKASADDYRDIIQRLQHYKDELL